MTTTLSLNGVDCTLTLGKIESDSDRGGWVNGTIRTPDGQTFAVGGGWIHSPESALHANRCAGLQTDTHPELYWPGAVSEGDFAAYEGYDNGDLGGLAAAVGLDIDRNTDEGDANWLAMVDAVRIASTAAFAAGIPTA